TFRQRTLSIIGTLDLARRSLAPGKRGSVSHLGALGCSAFCRPASAWLHPPPSGRRFGLEPAMTCVALAQKEEGAIGISCPRQAGIGGVARGGRRRGARLRRLSSEGGSFRAPGEKSRRTNSRRGRARSRSATLGHRRRRELVSSISGRRSSFEGT